MNETIPSIAIIGAGNVATHLALGLSGKGFTIRQIFSRTEYNQRKSFNNGGSIIASAMEVEFSALEQNLKNNTQYTVTVTAYIDYGDKAEQKNVRNTFSFPLFVDFEAPTVTDVAFRTEYDRTTRETTYYADLSIYDNHYAMAVQAGQVTLEGNGFMLSSFGKYFTPVYSSFNSTSTVTIELTDYIDKQDKVFIIVLDEIDRSFQKNGDDIFYYMTTINEVLQNSKVSIVGITNNANFTELLGQRVKSRLGEEKIIFPPYNVEQLQDILYDRAKNAFDEGVLDDDVIPYCAALSAQEMGDARRALDLLRMAADFAERNGDTKVTGAHVRYAKNKIELDAVSEVVKTLTIQSKIVLMSIIRNTDEGMTTMTTGDVYATYKFISEAIGQSVLTQRRIAGLISELDMLGIIHARVKSFGRAGRTKEIELSTPKEIISMIKNDEIFKVMKDRKQTTLM